MCLFSLVPQSMSNGDYVEIIKILIQILSLSLSNKDYRKLASVQFNSECNIPPEYTYLIRNL